MCEQKLLFVLMLFAFCHSFYVNAKICENVRVTGYIGNNKPLENSLRGCTKILGSLQILHFEHHHIKEIEFPELTEITGFVLFYRIYGLTSIGKLLPNLKIIGGERLLLDYAFVLYDLPNLRDIGLKNLRYIGRGSTRIERCPRLCYVETIDWDLIGRNGHSLHYYDKNFGDCPECPKQCEGPCWNKNNCQKREVGKCVKGCVLCNNDNQCERCEGYLDNGKCTPTCSNDKYGHLSTHTCVTKEECKNLGYQNWFIFQEQCTKTCPEGYIKVSQQEGFCKHCGNDCTKICKNTTIAHAQIADSFRGCTDVYGNLEIAVNKHLTVDQLVYGLGSIRTIHGYLKVYESHGITSLNFLRNLKEIKGNTLYQNRYSVVVMDNRNLEKLWDWDVSIKQGTIMFHYNPKLCRSEIEGLIRTSDLTGKYTIYDVSPYSNGEENLCTILDVQIDVIHVNPTEVNITWNVAVEGVIGYLLHCTEDPHGNITVPEMQKICEDLNNGNRFAKYVVHNKMLVTGLNPYTNYAFYIQISTNTAYFAGRTEIYRFKTKQGTPSGPQNIQVVNVDSSSITLSWKPPKLPGGIMEQYKISVYSLQDDDILIKDVDYCHRSQYLPNLEGDLIHLEEESCCSEKGFKDWNLDNLDIVNYYEEDNGTPLHEIKVNSSTIEYTISNLQYYCNYVLYLRACNNIPSCSRPVRIYQRTKPLVSADNIPSDMTFDIKDGNSVLVKWLPPLKPNSYVASYLVSYKNIELENSMDIVECVTVHQYAEYGGHLITNLSPAKYAITVSAVSLAGLGKISETLYFEIDEVENTNLIEIYLIIFGFLFGFICIVFCYFYFKRNKMAVMRIERDVQLSRSDLELALDDSNGDEHPLLGLVRNGLITSQNRPCTVKFGSKHNTKETFLNEIRKLRDIKSSHHVVTLLGLVWQQQQPLLVMELLAWGDLKSFLISSRCDTALAEDQIIRMAAEIADGLLYLTAHHIVHPDLAARNCLVSAGYTVKVASFGINRDIYGDDYYKDKTRGVIPVRWMAPETITDGVLNCASNIWSYGILIWEIVTAAEKPYEDLSDEEVMRFVIGQHTMNKPDNCSELMHSIMDNCWKWKSANRTSLPKILHLLFPHIRRDFKLVSFYNSSNCVKYLASLKNKDLINKDTSVRWKVKDTDVTIGVVNEAMQEDLNLPSTSSSK